MTVSYTVDFISKYFSKYLSHIAPCSYSVSVLHYVRYSMLSYQRRALPKFIPNINISAGVRYAAHACATRDHNYTVITIG